MVENRREFYRKLKRKPRACRQREPDPSLEVRRSSSSVSAVIRVASMSITIRSGRAPSPTLAPRRRSRSTHGSGQPTPARWRSDRQPKRGRVSGN